LCNTPCKVVYGNRRRKSDSTYLQGRLRCKQHNRELQDRLCIPSVQPEFRVEARHGGVRRSYFHDLDAFARKSTCPYQQVIMISHNPSACSFGFTTYHRLFNTSAIALGTAAFCTAASHAADMPACNLNTAHYVLGAPTVKRIGTPSNIRPAAVVHYKKKCTQRRLFSCLQLQR